MTDLIDVVDAAFPFDYRLLGASVKVVLGYVGQYRETPHVWTQSEVDAVRKAGRVWAPIHTPPPGTLTADTGRQAANAMRSELAGYDYPAGGPVFLDIEAGSYFADPGGAKDCAGAWAAEMRSDGHDYAVPYLPLAAGIGWRAGWGGPKPTVLPPFIVGWQWRGAPTTGKPYDESVFDPAVFAALLGTEDDDMPLNTADKAWIADQLETVQTGLAAKMTAYAWDSDPKNPMPAALVHLGAKLDETLAAIKAVPAGTVNVDTLAGELAVRLGPTLGAALVTALAAKLA